VIYKDMIINPAPAIPWCRLERPRRQQQWTFHTIAQPGDPGHDTWAGIAGRRPAAHTFGVALAGRRARHRLPSTKLRAATTNGGERVGDNLYGTSIIALDATTGKLKWYRQVVHHDIWDYDLEAPPMRYDVVVTARRSRARGDVQSRKPLHSQPRYRRADLRMEERPVPQTSTTH